MLGFAADACADVETAWLCRVRAQPSSTACGAFRSCCSPTSSITACRRWASGFDNWTSGLIALIIYNTAYMAEILRGAWVAQPREPIEAGIAFGFPDFSLFRRIILPPLLLVGRARDRQPDDPDHQGQRLSHHHRAAGTDACREFDPVRHYVPFAAFITAVFLYWGLCLVVEAGVNFVGRLAEARR